MFLVGNAASSTKQGLKGKKKKKESNEGVEDELMDAPCVRCAALGRFSCSQAFERFSENMLKQQAYVLV